MTDTKNADLERLSQALVEFSTVEAGISALRQTYAGVVYDVRSPLGMAAARHARKTIREPRYKVEDVRKEAKAPLLALGRRLDAEAKRITEALLAIETPISAQIESEEQRIEAERQAKIEAERQRVAAIQERITELKGVVAAAATCTADELLEHIGDTERLTVDESFAEFRELADKVKADSLVALRRMHAAAVERQREAERLRAERAELDQQRAEQQERERADQERRAAEERTLQVERDRIAAENRRLADERAAFERQQEEARAAAEAAAAPKPEPAPEPEAPTGPTVRPPLFPKPADSSLRDTIASEYFVPADVADAWLRAYGTDSVAAAA